MDQLKNICGVLEEFRQDKQDNKALKARDAQNKRIQEMKELMKVVKVGDRVELRSSYFDRIPTMLHSSETVFVQTQYGEKMDFQSRKFTVTRFSEDGIVWLTPGKQMIGKTKLSMKERNFTVEFWMEPSDITSPFPAY